MRKVLLVLLILLVIGVIVGDRVAHSVAQDEIAKQVASKEQLASKPDVSIGGFPFLTQAIGGSYGDIDVSIDSYDDKGVRLTDVKVKLRDVDAPLSDILSGDASNVVAGTATAEAVVPYDVVDARAPRGVKVKPSGDDLQLSGNLSFAGLSRNVTATVSVRAVDSGIQVTPKTVRDTAGTDVPLGLVQQRFTFIVPVSDLPLGSKISKVEPTPAGLRLAATAKNVKLSEAERVSR